MFPILNGFYTYTDLLGQFRLAYSQLQVFSAQFGPYVF